MTGIYRDIYPVYAQEDKKDPKILSTLACRPSTYERAHSSFVSLATAAAAAVTTRLWPIIGRCIKAL